MILPEERYWEGYRLAAEKVWRNSEKIGVSFPQVAIGEQGLYNKEEPWYWTGGFWGGLVWLAYRALHDSKLFELACEIEEAQDAPLNAFENMHHDVGFMWLPTAVYHYRQTGCHASKIRGLKAAAILGSRFNLKGNFIRAWNDEEKLNRSGYVIVDCMMNIPLLFWASRELNDPRFAQIAEAHADTVLRHFVREDYSVPHIRVFDPNTGECLGGAPGQGRSLESKWSRGQAWAIYGFASAYRETGKGEYLETAEKMAENFYEHLPKDLVPFWDFCSDEKDQYARDSSAACIVSSGMMEIAMAETDEKRKEKYQNMAKDILGSLIENYACFDDRTQGIVTMGTVNYTHGRHINVPIIYGDFYFLEALGKLQGLPGMF